MNMILPLLITLALPVTSILEPCPSSPNCVSSLSSGSQFIKPFTISGEAVSSFDYLLTILQKREDTTVVSVTDREIRAEFKTALGFVDDGNFVLEAEKGLIHVRSVSRTGYWDLGKNRRRLEKIRKQLLDL